MGKCISGKRRTSPPASGRTFPAPLRGGGDCPAFYNAIRHYGADAIQWDVLAKIIPEWANAAEQNAILACRSVVPHGYNIREGGSNAPVSPATRLKMSRAAVAAGRIPPSQRGRKRADSTRAALSALHKGKPKKKSAIAKTAAAHRGRKRSAAARKNMSDAAKRRAKK